MKLSNKLFISKGNKKLNENANIKELENEIEEWSTIESIANFSDELNTWELSPIILQVFREEWKIEDFTRLAFFNYRIWPPIDKYIKQQLVKNRSLEYAELVTGTYQEFSKNVNSWFKHNRLKIEEINCLEARFTQYIKTIYRFQVIDAIKKQYYMLPHSNKFREIEAPKWEARDSQLRYLYDVINTRWEWNGYSPRTTKRLIKWLIWKNEKIFELLRAEFHDELPQIIIKFKEWLFEKLSKIDENCFQ